VSEKLINKIAFVTIGITALSIIGFIVLNFLPADLFYEWSRNPIKMNKEVYKPCEVLEWTVNRKTRVESPVTVTERIINGSPVHDREYSATLTLPNEWVDVPVEWDVGCLRAGTYRLTGVVTFEIMGVDKHYTYSSEPFKIEGDVHLDEFIGAGKRFTYCDGVRLYSTLKDIPIPEECLNATDTDFYKFIN